jgi:hypothetical protein
MRRLLTGIALSVLGCGSANGSGDDDVAGSGGQAGSNSTSGGSSAGTANAAGTSNAGAGSGNVGVGGTGGNAVAGSGGTPSGGDGGGSSGSTGVSTQCTEPVGPGFPDGAPALEAGSWKAINPAGFPFDENTSSLGLAVDPCNPAVLYLCTGSFDTSIGGLYKSIDAGSNWTRVGNVEPDWTNVDHLEAPLHVEINPSDTQHLYLVQGVRGRMGFYISTDGGENFAMPEGFSSHGYLDVYSVDVDPTDFNHLLVSFHSPFSWDDPKYFGAAGVMESTDGGETWLDHDPAWGWGFGHVVNFLYRPELGIGDANTWLLGTQDSGLIRTTDAGESWTQVSETGIQHGGGTIYYGEDGTLYAAGAPNNLRSTDNGESWTAVGAPNGYNAIIGDGDLLYTAPCFGPGPFLSSPESDGSTWTPFNGQDFGMGPFDMALDSVNRVLYSSNWHDGLLALKLE